MTFEDLLAEARSFEDKLSEHLSSIDGDYVPAEVAEKFLVLAREQFPDELEEWLQERAAGFVAQWITTRERKKRRETVKLARRRKFGEATTMGNLHPFTEVHFVVDDNNTQRPLGAMKGVDHKFVAACYTASGFNDGLRAHIHLALAKRVGGKRTDEALTEEEYVQILGTLGG